MRFVRANSVVRALTILGLGAAGLVGGHALGYAFSVPDPYHRSDVLAATGHGYIPSASRAAVMLGIAAVAAGIASGYLHRPRAAHPSFTRVLVRLVALQCGAFVALEISERVLSSAPIGSLSVQILLLGLLTQTVMAVAAAVLVAGLRRIGAALRGDARAAPATIPADVVLAARVAPSSRTLVRDRVRAPPALRMV